MATRVDRRDREDEPRGRRDRDDDDRGRDWDRDRDEDPPRSNRDARRSSRDDDDRDRDRDRDRDDRPRRGGRDDEDDRPRSRSRDDDDDDRPRRRPARDEDDDRPRRGRDDDDERPRRSSRDEDDDRPRRSSRDDEDDRPRSRSRGRDDDEDRPRSKSRDDDGVGSGWAGSRRQREKARSTERFEMPDPEKQEDNALVKCLEDAPFASVGVHWVDFRDGRKAVNCPDDPRKDEDSCPVCGAGHAPSAYDFFNIATLTGTRWKNAYIKAGQGLSKEMETANGARSGPLSRPYYEVNQRGGRGNKSGPPHYKWDVVRERDLADEWKIDPLSDEELDELYEKRFRRSDVFRPASPEDLKAAAREVRDRD